MTGLSIPSGVCGHRDRSEMGRHWITGAQQGLQRANWPHLWTHCLCYFRGGEQSSKLPFCFLGLPHQPGSASLTSSRKPDDLASGLDFDPAWASMWGWRPKERNSYGYWGRSAFDKMPIFVLVLINDLWLLELSQGSVIICPRWGVENVALIAGKSTSRVSNNPASHAGCNKASFVLLSLSCFFPVWSLQLCCLFRVFNCTGAGCIPEPGLV